MFQAPEQMLASAQILLDLTELSRDFGGSKHSGLTHVSNTHWQCDMGYFACVR